MTGVQTCALPILTVQSSGSEEVAISAGVNAGEKVIVEWPKGVGDGVAVKELK